MQERFEIGIIHKEELTETKIRQANNRLSPLGVSLVPEPSGSGTYLLTVRVRKNSRNAGKHDFPVFKRLSNIQKHSSDEDNRVLPLFYRVFNRFQQRKQICRCLPKENRLFSFGIPQESFHRILIQKKGYILYKY